MTDEEKKALEAQKQNETPAGGNDVVVGEETQQGKPAVTVTTPTEKPNSAVPHLDNLIESYGKKVADHPRQEKLERTQAMIGGIADMGSALSNLYFTNQYAPNAYDPKEGMSEKMRERFDKAKAQRDKDRDAWLNYVLQKGKIEESEKALAYKEKKDESDRAINNEKLELEKEKFRRLQGLDELKAQQLEWDHQMKEKTFDLKKAELELKRMVAEKKISIAQAKLAQSEIQHKLQEYTETENVERDNRGRVIRRTKERKTNNNQQGGGSLLPKQNNSQKGSGSLLPKK